MLSKNYQLQFQCCLKVHQGKVKWTSRIWSVEKAPWILRHHIKELNNNVLCLKHNHSITNVGRDLQDHPVQPSTMSQCTMRRCTAFVYGISSPWLYWQKPRWTYLTAILTFSHLVRVVYKPTLKLKASLPWMQHFITSVISRLFSLWSSHYFLIRQSYAVSILSALSNEIFTCPVSILLQAPATADVCVSATGAVFPNFGSMWYIWQGSWEWKLWTHCYHLDHWSVIII